MIPAEILEKIGKERHAYEKELMEFIRIPSVSADPKHANDVRKAAEWVLEKLQKMGFEGRSYETEGHPVIYAERCPYKDQQTLLIYGHYDVQPPDPVEAWKSPPFSPEIRDGYIYGRGATDDKGQFLTYLKAIEAILSESGEIPINVKFLVEGEEELGSINLVPFVKKHKKELEADAIAISDSAQFASGMPTICYGLRGITYLQLDVYGPAFDLHSGHYGGAVANPANVLVEILSRLMDNEGKILIPGFYDDVIDIEPWECKEMASLPYEEEAVKKHLCIKHLKPEKGYTPLECMKARPTLDINGIWGGYSGPGTKTIIPSKAGAKVSMRLVPDQDPEKITALFKEYVNSISPEGVTVQMTEFQKNHPVIVPRENDTIKAAFCAIQSGFGKTPVFIREGGSIGIVSDFKNVLGIENILLIGWGSPDDGAHSPNERFSLEDFNNGIKSAAALLYELKV
ncbi:peptidase [Methanocella sp. CWC-04]|uniref:Peptidase n=1 Tax=Methanooceanicella nereidis TaxID=2052831 RepID=A0AAP2W5F3_9EURY|nr:dipeptidase [Methanocella sp. CWC-04]MCD1294132.1 peptidase [Methanocella sp. CWC-04]